MSNKDLKITTPRGEIIKIRTKNGQITARLTFNPILGARLTQNINKAQMFIDSEVLRLSSAFVPLQSGMLQKSGILGTVIGSGEVKWIAPYSKYQYFKTSTSRIYDPDRGAYWFERVKALHKNRIIRGAKKLGGK